MDDAGIDVQVLSHGAPSTQRLDAATAVPLAKRANDRLHEAVRAHPDRFAGFAALPTADPKAAADELERAVDKLGFKGAMVHGPTNGVFFRRQALLADLRARPGARRSALSAPVAADEGGGRRLLQGLPRPLPAAAGRRLGLHGRDRDAGRAAWCSRACSRSILA